jgi:hypothetical protein
MQPMPYLHYNASQELYRDSIYNYQADSLALINADDFMLGFSPRASAFPSFHTH